jgi:GDP-L-fucose synthase
VLPALIRKFHEAKINNSPTVTVWGSGSPRREFLHSDDAAKGCYFLMQEYEQPTLINLGCGEDHSIGEMARMIKKITGFTGQLVFDSSKPDGTMQKLLDVSKLAALGFKASIGLEEGIARTYKEFCENYDHYITKKHGAPLSAQV